MAVISMFVMVDHWTNGLKTSQTFRETSVVNLTLRDDESQKAEVGSCQGWQLMGQLKSMVTPEIPASHSEPSRYLIDNS